MGLLKFKWLGIVAILVITPYIFPFKAATQTIIPGQMIEISATIYEFNYKKESQFGIFYEYNRTKGAMQNSNIFLPGTENITDKAVPALDLTGSLLRWDYGSIDFNIKTAITEGWGTIINNPTLLVADGEPSSLIGGEEVPLTVLMITGNQSRLELSKRKVGIKLNVTPRIFRENTVLMNLEIESSEIIRYDTFDRGDKLRYELPVVTTRNVKTVVIIPSGKKLYIGGLYTDTSGNIRRKVPILGDIPGLGYVFSGFNKKKRRTETVFQITPIITSPGSGLSTADDSVFSDLLKSDTGTEYIRQKQILDNIKQQHDGMVPAGESSASSKTLSATPTLQTSVGTIAPASAPIVTPTTGTVKIPPSPSYSDKGQASKAQATEKKTRSKSRQRFYFR